MKLVSIWFLPSLPSCELSGLPIFRSLKIEWPSTWCNPPPPNHPEWVPAQPHNSFLDQRSRKVIVWFHMNHFCAVMSLRLCKFCPFSNLWTLPKQGNCVNKLRGMCTFCGYGTLCWNSPQKSYRLACVHPFAKSHDSLRKPSRPTGLFSLRGSTCSTLYDLTWFWLRK